MTIATNTNTAPLRERKVSGGAATGSGHHFGLLLQRQQADCHLSAAKLPSGSLGIQQDARNHHAGGESKWILRSAQNDKPSVIHANDLRVLRPGRADAERL